ncbi:MAG: FGGY family carbohydrate kinase, partial [Saprospiraceae bacterium]|nr:FGGY family carbohydrate kinase [Saprospiraceae bacterium]
MASYAIGYDVGSSSVKAALVRVDDGATMIVVQYPETEMRITSPQPGWAEQDPEDWWQALCAATHQLLERSGVAPRQIASIGLAYQMHGLVLVDTDGKPVRPAIIWCDSRAVETGDQALRAMGAEYCFGHLLNSPGNFTAARLKWVIDHEPEIYQQAQYLLLPGDFLALRLTGTACTTISGLSEAILWDFAGHRVAQRALDYFGIDPQKVPPLTDTFGQQGVLSRQGAEATGLMAGTPLTYRAGDQPNNAMSLGVVHAGEVAATGGTSGVIYGVADRLISDPESRVNSFAHVTHTVTDPRIGMLLCINGAGIEHAWMKHHVAHPGATYEEMERAMQSV